MAYNPEDYWTDLATRTKKLSSGIQAGDDEPFYIYKRSRFLDLFRRIDFENQKVLEVGCGPGSNLLEVLSKRPKELHAADISHAMLNHAKSVLGDRVTFTKTDGKSLDLKDNYFDIVFTVTVLQHNTQEKMLQELIESICKVADRDVYFFERIESKIKGDDLNLGRPISYYNAEMVKHGYRCVNVEFINIYVSYLMAGVFRKTLNKRSRKEGDPSSRISLFLQKTFLPLTKLIDPLIKKPKGLAMLHFKKINV